MYKYRVEYEDGMTIHFVSKESDITKVKVPWLAEGMRSITCVY